MEFMDPLASPPRTPPTSTVAAVDLELSFLKRAVEAPLCKDLGELDEFTLDCTLDGLSSSATPTPTRMDEELVATQAQAQGVPPTPAPTPTATAVAASKAMLSGYSLTSETQGRIGLSGGNGTLLRTAGSGQLRIAARAAKPRTYQDATPSKHCHVCSARPSAASPHMWCANLRRGTCRKTVCAKCFGKHGWDWNAARANPRHWACPHCRGVCPRAAQCFIYGRTTKRRRENARRVREAARASAGAAGAGTGTTPDRVAVAAKRAALLAEQIVRAAHSREWGVGVSVGDLCTVSSGTDGGIGVDVDVGTVEPPALSWVGVEHSKKMKDEAVEVTSAEIGNIGVNNMIDGEDEVGGGLFGELFV